MPLFVHCHLHAHIHILCVFLCVLWNNTNRENVLLTFSFFSCYASLVMWHFLWRRKNGKAVWYSYDEIWWIDVTKISWLPNENSNHVPCFESFVLRLDSMCGVERNHLFTHFKCTRRFDVVIMIKLELSYGTDFYEKYAKQLECSKEKNLLFVLHPNR